MQRRVSRKQFVTLFCGLVSLAFVLGLAAITLLTYAGNPFVYPRKHFELFLIVNSLSNFGSHFCTFHNSRNNSRNKTCSNPLFIDQEGGSLRIHFAMVGAFLLAVGHWLCQGTHTNHCLCFGASTDYLGVVLFWSSYHCRCVPCRPVVLREKCEWWKSIWYDLHS